MLIQTTLRCKRISQTVVLNSLSALVRMDAETFCERWFEIDSLKPPQKEQIKQERGYRARCVRILCAVLKKPHKTVDSWGAKFEKMPDDARTILAYADALRVQLKATPDEFLELFIQQRSQEY
ncbi:MAG: hypothetical protein SW833_17910 [Cyanobacteriota bacterium]|nr:hypothetical protein [Cyanobacteriota bacterium]